LKESEKGIDKMTIQEFIKTSGMTHKQLSDRFGIPKRTIEDWSRGVRKCPEYVVNMMMELLERDKIEK
jgi:DNA-binding transcriptional regulator YiaG